MYKTVFVQCLNTYYNCESKAISPYLILRRFAMFTFTSMINNFQQKFSSLKKENLKLTEEKLENDVRVKTLKLELELEKEKFKTLSKTSKETMESLMGDIEFYKKQLLTTMEVNERLLEELEKLKGN